MEPRPTPDRCRGGRLFRRRPGVCYGGQCLRRTLCHKCSGLGEDPQGTRFDPGGGAAAGDGNWQAAQLGHGIKAGRTVRVVGAVGSVGRSAVFTAKESGAAVIAGVLKRQMDEAKTVGADQAVATDDDTAIANLPPLDAVADTVGGRTAEKLIAKVKPGGVYASVVVVPQNAAKYPSVKVVHVFSKFDRKTLEFMAEAVRDGKLVIPISQKLPLREAAAAQAAAEKGGSGKILLVA